MEYVQGNIITMWGSEYRVEKVYEMPDEVMKRHNLFYKNRVTLKKISGENGPETMDFAIVE
jgi:hypothetical protein